MLEIKASVELIDHLRNHLSDLVQTHESYQIQWESRLNNAVGLCRKEFQIFDRLCRFLDHAGLNRVPG